MNRTYLRPLFVGVLIAASCALGSAHAASVAGVNVPDSATLGSKTLSLNGVGIQIELTPELPLFSGRVLSPAPAKHSTASPKTQKPCSAS
jgi:hypothetical protein